MTKEALTQLAEIEAITQPEPELAPGTPPAVAERSRRAESGHTTTKFKSWHPGRQRKPEPVLASVDDDDDSDAIADDGADSSTPVGWVQRLVVLGRVSGLPDISADPAVIEAKANAERLAEQRVSVVAEIAGVEGALGLKPGASARDVEKIAVQLLAAGKDDSDITKLEALRARHRRLTSAEGLANRALMDAQADASRKLTAQAWQVEFVPAARKVALAFLELIRCKQEEQAARHRVRSAGFGEPDGTFGGPELDPWNNPTLQHLVRNNYLTADEVRAICPDAAL